MRMNGLQETFKTHIPALEKVHTRLGLVFCCLSHFSSVLSVVNFTSLHWQHMSIVS